MTTQQVNEFTAHGYSDNYAILKDATGDCVGCEHNQTEADALVRWLNNYHGGGYSVRRNRPDQVRAAKQWHPQPIRHQCRDQAFEETGIFR